MAGPWEKYAAQAQDQGSGDAAQAPASGPWLKYQPTPEQPGALDGMAKGAIDSLPMLGGMVGGVLGTPADVVAGPMGNMAGAAVGGYLGTATKNLINGFYDPQSAPKSVSQAVSQPVVGGVEQGLMQGTGEAVTPYVAKGLKSASGAVSSATKWVGTKVLSNTGTVSPDVIKEYAQFSNRINSAPTLEKLKDISDEVVGKLASDVDAGKITASQAQDAYNQHLSDLKDAYKTAGYDARDALTSANQTLKDAHNARLQQISGDVYDTINRLKSDVQTGSASALKTLDNSNAKVDLAPVYSSIDSSIDRLKQAGTDEALSVADKLQDYKTRLMSKNWALIAPQDAKRLIQGLDQITEYSPMAGSFDKAKNAAFKGVRASLDQSVKAAVPEYRAAMEPVASDAALLDRVQGFGDKQSAVGLLGRIHAPNQLENRAALQELGKKYGADYISAAQPENLPEQALVNKAQGTLEALRPDRVADKIDQTLASSRQKAALDSAQSELQAAQEKLAPYKSLAPNGAGQTQAQQKLMQLGKGKNIELEGMFQNLGKLTNTDFVQAMKDQNTLAAFQKGATNGSRNTLMGALAGFAFGGVGGAAAGGTAGRVVDQWGPAITKKVLDGVIKVANTPTMATIAQLEIPEALKRNLVIGLENYYSNAGQMGEQAAMRNIADQSKSNPQQNVSQGARPLNRTPARGQDAWAQRGIQNLGIQDAGLANRILQDPNGKQLLIQASDLPRGSKAAQKIMNQIQTTWGTKQ